MSLDRDLEFVADVVRNFFKKDHIQPTLTQLGETWGGCEGWL